MLCGSIVDGGVKVVEKRRFEIPLWLNAQTSEKPTGLPVGSLPRAGEIDGGSTLELVLHAVAGALQDNRLGVVEQAVQNG